LSAKIQFLTEMLMIEVDAPEMKWERDSAPCGVPLLRFNAGLR
jgi:hypothetical protein